MVTQVWGKADSFELVFSPLGNDQWSAIVPADLEDGQYIVELYCCDDSGNTAYWTGILYLNKSDAVQIRIVADKFKVWLEMDIYADIQADSRIWMEDDLKIRVTFTNVAWG